MKNINTFISRFKTVLLLSAVLVIATACGGEGGDEPPANNTTTSTISGTAAAGAPIVGIVNVLGANSLTASSPIESDGSYSVDVSALMAPFILYAEGSVTGKSISMYSAAVTDGIVNITPITDFILRNALAGPAETAYTNWGTTQVGASVLSAAEADVQAQLSPLLTAANVSSDIDLLATPFAADRTGLDAVLDALSITYNGNTATIENNWTGSIYTDDITQIGDSAGLPASDETVTQQVLTDASAIDAFWQSLEDLYITQPADAAITTWANSNIAVDFLERGINRTEELGT